jgi:hypothetical protein
LATIINAAGSQVVCNRLPLLDDQERLAFRLECLGNQTPDPAIAYENSMAS